MAFWLFKSEPDSWSWDQQVEKGAAGEEWSGVRNHQARNFMREMTRGEKGFFYHSNVGKAIVGVVEVCAEAAQDSTTEDRRWECVHIRAVTPLLRPVTLEACKADDELRDMVLVSNSRLSVQPVREAEWRHICEMGGIDPDQTA